MLIDEQPIVGVMKWVEAQSDAFRKGGNIPKTEMSLDMHC